MKTKRLMMKNILFYEQECILFLEEMSYQGWKLKSIGTVFFHFVRYDHPLKYQFDYNELNEEYLQIIKEQGYEHIDCYGDIHIYANENLQAMDLQTDENVHQQILLQHYKKSYMIILFVLGLLLLYGGLWYCLDLLQRGEAYFYTHFQQFLFFVFIALCGLDEWAMAFITYLKRKSVLQSTYSYQKFRKLDLCVEYVSLFVLLSVIFYGTIHNQFISIVTLLIGLVLIMIVTQYFQMRIIPKQKNKKKRILFSLVFSFIYIISYCALFMFPSGAYDHIQSLPKDYPLYHDVYRIQNNIFVHQIEAATDTADEDHYSYQNFYHCRNQKIADTIFEYEIVQVEKETRMPSEEEMWRIASEKGEWSMDDISALSYESALTLFTPYHSQYFEECYYLNDMIVAKKDCLVVRIIVEDKSQIDPYLKDYLKF